MGSRENYVEALRTELAFCEQFGKDRRAADVRAELAQFDDTPPAPAVETADEPAKPRGRGRKADAEDAG